MAIFDQSDFLGLLGLRVEQKTYSTICGTPAPAILNHENSTGSAGGAREGQSMAHLGHINGPYFDLPWPLLLTRSNFMVQNGWKRFPAYHTTCLMFDPHLWGVFQASKVSFVKNRHFWLFWVKIRGSLTLKRTVGQNENFYKIRHLETEL